MSHERMMMDGFSTIITLANVPTIKLYEKEVTPPSWEMGGPIDVTNMRSNNFRRNWPKQLASLGAMTIMAAYASSAMSDIISQKGINQLITLTYPDQSLITFWGYIDSFTPSAHVEGEQPTATVVIQPTLMDENGDEIDPNWNEPVGES